MRINLYLIFLFNLISVSVFSQAQTEENTKIDYFSYLQNDMYGGKVKINQNDNIKLIFNKHIEYNEKLSSCQGYRIRIFSDSGHTARESANKAKADFLKLFPEIESYLKYDQPNWKVLIGDFRTKSDALKFLKLISDNFPSAFIVKDMIAFPRLN
ncbi:MAG: hypothetical protein A2046_00790 [Bacteroidetes bacterium GWA2_30_7]|nr:MAG: hypothetical protein A2046_00790 [Bacteroidetes bacterium GWA2_30_7]